jgi:metal-responsive CopG/Arc/MetJ family transcriptional regulator
MNKEPKELRIPLMMENSLVKEIDDFRFSNRIATRAEAVRTLIKMSLKNPEMKTATD